MFGVFVSVCFRAFGVDFCVMICVVVLFGMVCSVLFGLFVCGWVWFVAFIVVLCCVSVE